MTSRPRSLRALLFLAGTALLFESGRAAAAGAVDDENAARAEPHEPIVAKLPRVRFSGFTQVDWVAMNQNSQEELDVRGQPQNQERFVLRRARLRADVDRGLITGGLELDANTVSGPQVRPIAAEVTARWPVKRGSPYDFALTMGLIQTPFGAEVQELDYVRPFLERSAVSNAFFPGVYDLGMRFRGRYRFLHYAFGLMNGDPIGDKSFPGRDPNKSKDLVFRVGVKTDVTRRIDVDMGFSGLSGSGFHAGTPTTKDQLVWRDTNEDGIVDTTEIQVIPGTAATPSQTFRRFGVGADLKVRVNVGRLGHLTLRGEIMRGNNLDRGLFIADPISTGHDLRETGYYVGLSQEVTRYGLLGVRYDRYDPDSDASEQQGLTLVPRDRSVSTFAMLAGLRLPNEHSPLSAGRLLFEYDRNYNALGRGTNGTPTTLASDTAILRAEITY